MQAACGLAQMDRAARVRWQARKDNFHFLKAALKPLEDVLILPEATPNSDPSWFGFPVTLRDGVKKSRTDLQLFHDGNKVGTAAALRGQSCAPALLQGYQHRVHGDLTNTDVIMNRNHLGRGLSWPQRGPPVLYAETFMKFFVRK